jgi:uncharacterized membrane protein YbaN (DUF454 family)
MIISFFLNLLPTTITIIMAAQCLQMCKKFKKFKNNTIRRQLKRDGWQKSITIINNIYKGYSTIISILLVIIYYNTFNYVGKTKKN